MKYLFLLGRNPKLSAAEIFSYLEREKISVLSYLLRDNCLLLEPGKELNAKELISSFGGTIAIGKVLIEGEVRFILRTIKEKELYSSESIKFSYSLMDFCQDENAILEQLKEKFKNEGLKARYKTIRGNIKLQDGEIYQGTPSKIKSADIIYFLLKDKNYYFGILQEVYDSREAEKRDMNKPFRRQELAISPRLAKILINLSQVEEGETLLDPFCGIGVILQESLLSGINTIGVDVNGSVVENARKNLNWLKENYQINAGYRLINADSTKINLAEEISGIVTEPQLGILLTKSPNEKQSLKMLREFESLTIKTFSNLKKYLKPRGKIAFTSPLILTGRKRFGCDIQRICEETRLRLCKLPANLNFPIQEYREKQVVGREIFVLEREG